MASKQIYDYVERLGELLRTDSRQAIAEYGLQPVQLEVLHYLSICNLYSDTPMAVTEYLGQTKGTVSQTLKVLEKKGLISKNADKNDRRVSHMKVTAKGKRLIKKTLPTPMFTKGCSTLSERKQEEIIAILRHLLITLLQANNMKTFGVCHTCRYNKKTKEDGYFCNLVKQPLTNNDIQLICREHEHKPASQSTSVLN